MEKFEAECNEKVRNVQHVPEAAVNSLREHVREYAITITLHYNYHLCFL